MRIPEFTVSNTRNIRLAHWKSLPPIMIITGPNGCGKSTLLNALRNVSGEGQILYLGPHRSSRRQTVKMRFLSQKSIEMSALLSTASLPGFEGLEIPNRTRDAWNFDEASSYLKYSLCQIELDRQSALTTRYDQDGLISKEQFEEDVWDPLRKLTENLLPHLRFNRIDVTNRDLVQCLWSVHALEIYVDIDELSSGEKAVVQLFYPLIEHQVREQIEAIKTGKAIEAKARKIAMLIDEPELHLHPNLQAKILEYIRKLALDEGVQFIMATHSPTIVEQASSSELFLLRPAELVTSDENQLVQIATDEERLSLMKDIFGTTSNITAMRKIVVVESVNARPDSRRTSDSRIYGFLSERFGQVTLVAGGGKNECKTLVESLNDVLKSISPHLRATALLDRDIDEELAGADAIYLPVSTIENLLVDPNVIWEAIITVRHKVSLQSAAAIEAALDDILANLENQEIARRTKATIGVKFFRLKDPIAEAEKQVEAFIGVLKNELAKDRLDAALATAKSKIEKLKAENKRREHFDGKAILNEFYRLHMHASGMSREIFIYECARQASKRRSVSEFVAKLFEIIGIDQPKSITKDSA